jgi:hypothetical protein
VIVSGIAAHISHTASIILKHDLFVLCFFLHIRCEVFQKLRRLTLAYDLNDGSWNPTTWIYCKKQMVTQRLRKIFSFNINMKNETRRFLQVEN